MTGEESWAEPGGLPTDGPMARTDAELREIVVACRRSGDPIPVVGLLGGDLCRTLGGRGDEGRLRSASARRLPVDVGSVLVDGVHHWFVAHLVARRGWLRGRVFVAMNAEWYGRWSLGPRAHPGDGLLDLSDGDPPLGDRIRARRRLVTGSHLPHPAIDTSRVAATQVTFDRPLRVYLDGVDVGRGRRLSIRVEPGVLTVVV